MVMASMVSIICFKARAANRPAFLDAGATVTTPLTQARAEIGAHEGVVYSVDLAVNDPHLRHERIQETS